MKAEVTFNVATDYIQTGFNELVKIGSYRWINGRCIWTFPLKHIKKAEIILGHPIEFPRFHQLEILDARMPMNSERADIPEFKGDSGFTVYDLIDEKKYEIVEWRKIENENGTIEIKEQKHLIGKGIVNCMRDILVNIDENRYKDGKISCRVLACKMMEMLHIDRFHRESGTFDWAKFNGNRKDYFMYYYYPLKILQSKNEIIHHKTGKITKLNGGRNDKLQEIF